MALPPLVSVEDLAVWLGMSVDRPRAEAVLSATSALARAETGTQWETDVPSEVHAVVLQAAGRAYKNPPSGVVQWSKGPFSERVLDAVALGIFFTDPEKAVLGRFRAGGRSGLYTLGVTRGAPMYDETAWVPTAPVPGPLFPFGDRPQW